MTYLVTWADGSVTEYIAHAAMTRESATILYDIRIGHGIPYDEVKAIIPHHAYRSIVRTQEVPSS